MVLSQNHRQKLNLPLRDDAGDTAGGFDSGCEAFINSVRRNSPNQVFIEKIQERTL